MFRNPMIIELSFLAYHDLQQGSSGNYEENNRHREGPKPPLKLCYRVVEIIGSFPKELMGRVQGFEDSRVQAFVFQRFNKSFLYLSTIHDGKILHGRITTNPA